MTNPQVNYLEPYGDVGLRLEVVVDNVPMSIRQLLSLQPGKTLPTKRPLGERLDLMAENVCLGAVELAASDGKVTVRVIEVAPCETA